MGGTVWPLEQRPLSRILRGEELRECEARIRPKQGDWQRVFSYGGSLVRDGDGKPLMAVMTVSDITRRKRAEESLRQSAEQFQTLANSIPNLAWWANGDGYITWYNRRWYEYTGTTPEQMEGWGWQSVHDPRILPRVLEQWRRSIATGQPFEMEFPLRGADGRFRPFLTRMMPLKDAEGRVSRWFGTNTDIAELKEAQEAVRRLKDELEVRVQQRTAELAAANRELNESEALARDRYAELDQIYRYAPVGLAISDRDGRFTRINERMAQINGFPPDYHLGKSIFEVIPDMAHRLQQLWRPVLERGQPVLDVELQGETPRAPGVHRAWLGNYFPLRSGQGEVVGVIAAVLEVTERKQAEEQLKRRNQHLHLLHQAAAELLLGRQPVDLIRALHEPIARNLGTEVFMLYTAAGDNSRLHLQACSGMTKEQQQKLETLRYGRAICARPAEALQPIVATHLQAVPAPNRHFVRKLGFQSYLYYPLIVDGRLQGTLAFGSRQRADYDRSELDFFQTIARTLAEALERNRLQSELKLHATQLEELVRERTAKLEEAMAELEHMSYSMIHDMRAPLRAMATFASFAEEACADCARPESHDYFRRIHESTRRLDRLITGALNYSEVVRESHSAAPVNLARLLRSMVQTYPNLQSQVADIAIELTDVVVLGNESLLTQCFGNLLDNAVKFVAPGVRPHVRLWAQPSTLDSQPSTLDSQPSTRIYIQDNGIGIPKAAQEKIFSMFQRMHRESEYPGTGIGLTIVRKGVERMHGRVGLESEPGKGCKFWIELPRAARAENTEPMEDIA